MTHDTLSAAEIDSLLSGLDSAAPIVPAQFDLSPAAACSAKFETALEAFALALQARLNPSSAAIRVTALRPMSGETDAIVPDALSRSLPTDDTVRLLCTRQLIASLVDFRFGGSGASEQPDSARLSVVERRAADRLFALLQEVWYERGESIEALARELPLGHWILRFGVEVGAGNGRVAIALRVGAESVAASQPQAEWVLIANLARIRLGDDSARKLVAGDVIAFSLKQPISIRCADVELLCQHGAHNGHHALRVLSVAQSECDRADNQAEPALELTLELGRLVWSEQRLRACAAGQLIELQRAIAEPLPLMRAGIECGLAEVVVLPDGHAMRILAYEHD